MGDCTCSSLVVSIWSSAFSSGSRLMAWKAGCSAVSLGGIGICVASYHGIRSCAAAVPIELQSHFTLRLRLGSPSVET